MPAKSDLKTINDYPKIFKLTDIPLRVSVTIEQNPLDAFVYGLRAPESKRQYPKRLKVVLDYIGLEGTLAEQSSEFYSSVRANPKWLATTMMQFISHQNGRVGRGEIAPSTIENYYKAVKLFIDMNFEEPVVNWKRLRRGLPRMRKAANDRAPTIEELRKLAEYPDRRIKAIVCHVK
jgi:hypothetical protein